MNDTELQQKWPELKKKLLEKYPHLTEEDLEMEIRNEGALLKELQKKLGKNWKEIKNILSLMG